MAMTNRLGILVSCLLVVACSSWQRPQPLEHTALRDHAQTMEKEGVTVRARVLSRQECLGVVGVDLNEQDIQPVWVEVENGSGQSLSLLQSGADPDYFSPLEVSWSLHSWGRSGNNAAIDEHMQSVAFRRGLIQAGETRSGLLFTNTHRNQKLMNIDLLGEQRFIPFAMIAPVPDSEGRITRVPGWRFESEDMVNYQDEQVFRDALMTWFADSLPGAGAALTEPLSLVWIGRPQDIGSVLVRRGYRSQAEEFDLEQRLSGRPPDFVLRKSGSGAPANWIRLWVIPMAFQGRPVLVAQAGAPIGGRFALGWQKGSADQALDGVRDFVIQDLLYSRGLIKLAIAHPPPLPGMQLMGDGRVGVLYIAARPLRFGDVRIIDWRDVDWTSEPEPYAEMPRK